MKMYPLEPAGEELLRRALAHSVAECEYPIPAQSLFTMFEEETTWREFFPVIRKAVWTSPPPFGVGTTRTVNVIGSIRLDEAFWAWTPGAQMGFQITAASNRAFQGLVELYDFIPLDDGQCQLRWEMGIELSGRMHVAESSMSSSLLRVQNWCLKRLARMISRRSQD